MAEEPEDTLTQRIGVLARRETEARILTPMIRALCEKFDEAEVLAIVRDTVIDLAQKQGRDLAEVYGDDIEAFLETLEFWQQDGALEIEILDQSDTVLNFDVKRCRYAEMYKALGIEDLGAVFSCNRDYAMVEGFNAEAKLERKHTIMEGNHCCTFRYTFPKRDEQG